MRVSYSYISRAEPLSLVEKSPAVYRIEFHGHFKFFGLLGIGSVHVFFGINFYFAAFAYLDFAVFYYKIFAKFIFFDFPVFTIALRRENFLWSKQHFSPRRSPIYAAYKEKSLVGEHSGFPNRAHYFVEFVGHFRGSPEFYKFHSYGGLVFGSPCKRQFEIHYCFFIFYGGIVKTRYIHASGAALFPRRNRPYYATFVSHCY